MQCTVHRHAPALLNEGEARRPSGAPIRTEGRVERCTSSDCTLVRVELQRLGQWALCGLRVYGSVGCSTSIGPALGHLCQPFSNAAQLSRTSRIGLDDERSDWLDGFLDLAETFLPRAILMENVSGFAQGAIAALSEIEGSLARINRLWGTHYRPEPRIVDAASFGVPHRLRRAIIVALRDGGQLAWPTATHDEAPIRAWNAIGRLAGHRRVHSVRYGRGRARCWPQHGRSVRHRPDNTNSDQAGSATRSLSSAQQLAYSIGPGVITTVYLGAATAGQAHAMTLALCLAVIAGIAALSALAVCQVHICV